VDLVKARSPILLLLLLTVILIQPPSVAGQDGFRDVCQEDPNQLLQNCDFSQGLNGWQTFIEGGQVSISTIDGGACHSPLCPAAFFVSNGSFIAGLYQQVPATPGVTYWANVTWLVFEPAGKVDNTVGRRVGIDPTGGTDPTSPAIVWSQELWRTFESCEYKICPELQVSVEAQNSTITVFVRIEDTWKDRHDEFSYVPEAFFGMEEQFWLDDVGVIPIGAAPAPPPEPPTPTPIPPTSTPAPDTQMLAQQAIDTPLPPTETPVPTEVISVSPTPEPTNPIPTDTPTPLPPTPTLTTTPTPTFTPVPPTSTSTPTPSPTVTPTATPEPFLPAGLGIVGGGAVCLVGAGLVVLLVVGAFLFWLYRLGMSEDEEYEDEEIWEAGDQEIWESGSRGIGKSGNREIRESGDREIWEPRSQKTEGSRDQDTEESGKTNDFPDS
jgi:hypothetical protein